MQGSLHIDSDAINVEVDQLNTSGCGRLTGPFFKLRAALLSRKRIELDYGDGDKTPITMTGSVNGPFGKEFLGEVMFETSMNP